MMENEYGANSMESMGKAIIASAQISLVDYNMGTIEELRPKLLVNDYFKDNKY